MDYTLRYLRSARGEPGINSPLMLAPKSITFNRSWPLGFEKKKRFLSLPSNSPLLIFLLSLTDLVIMSATGIVL